MNKNPFISSSVLLMLALFIFMPARSFASKYVTVATIGSSPDLDRDQDPQKLVKQVIAFWDRELKQVLPDKPDLIVLPEGCDLSGAGAAYRKVRKNQIQDFFSSVARANHCYIAYGTVRDEKEGIARNSCVLIGRNGEIAGIYDKNFPTIYEMDKKIMPGKEASVFQLDFGKVGIAICFDLNFDELRDKYAAQDPDLIIFSSVYHGGIAQNMWAYKCRSYFVGAVSNNPSQIRNPLGEVIASSSNYQDFVVSRINLDCELVHLDYNQAGLKSLKAKYGPRVTISDPGYLGCVLITSEDEKVNVQQMIKEFKIELLNDYFNRSREVRKKNL
jgi:apolipoprotein N-acyltransferase